MNHYLPWLVAENETGCPMFDIRTEQLRYLLNIRFSCKQIANIIRVSLSTIRRRMREYDLSVTSLYSIISDYELDQVV